MKKLDGYSYQCGVIDAFNEVVRAGVKRIALSHPVDSREEAMELIPFSQQICQQYGNHLLEQQAYQGEARRQIAVEYGKLLSYSPEAIERYLAQNEEKE